jgi:hypothetical protein
MERFNVRKLNEVEGKEQYQVKPQTGSQLWKTYIMMWTSIYIGKLLERISKFQPKRV